MDNTADAAHVADLERKVKRYEAALRRIASMPRDSIPNLVTEGLLYEAISLAIKTLDTDQQGALI